VLTAAQIGTASAATRPSGPELSPRSLDGWGYNEAHPTWGEAYTGYTRVAAAHYANNKGAMVAGPNARWISNRIFNDEGQNLFSENDLSQWVWAWGQFIDHDIGLRDETPGESAPIAFNSNDPLENFQNDFGALAFARTPAAPGTGVKNARQQVNTISSYIDASNVYGVNLARNQWLRSGANLYLPKGYLPRADARGNVAKAPAMDLMGRLTGEPADARVAGDVRANENIALTAIQTLFAREHNRIVASLPTGLSADEKFEIARRIVIAEVQYITYTEFLPALGITLSPYRGYNDKVNPSLTNEFATVGFRAHSMVHGEFDVDFEPHDYTTRQLAQFAAQGVAVTNTADAHSLTIPLSVAFGNPDLMQSVGLGAVLHALSGERQYKNDEQIDNTMRSVLFEVPKPGTTDQSACQTPVVDPRCFTGVADLAADDIERGRDHGMPSYNAMRRAYGLPPVRAFTAITGETTDRFPNDPQINGKDPIDDPHILDFVELRDRDGHVIDLNSPDRQEDAVTGMRRTTLAARLRAVYGRIDKIDAFVGMSAEKHVPGADFGPLQLAIWRDQFQRLRDGDPYFYAGDAELAAITGAYHVDYRHSLAEIVTLNTGVAEPDDVFHA
jgi:hypothetical protein